MKKEYENILIRRKFTKTNDSVFVKLIESDNDSPIEIFIYECDGSDSSKRYKVYLRGCRISTISKSLLESVAVMMLRAKEAYVESRTEHRYKGGTYNIFGLRFERYYNELRDIFFMLIRQE